jgi:hypothetical protein
MKTIGIIQPGRLGDIFICLPIAKYYSDKGYKVYWPVMVDFVNLCHFIADYALFIPVTSNVYKCVDEAQTALKDFKVTKIIDIAATFPGSNCTEEYVKLGDGFGPEKFDEFKYRLAKVPFKNKWDLQYTRDLDRENEVYNLYVKEKKYDVVSLKHSRGEANVQVLSKNQVIHINEKHRIVDWRKVLEGAENIVLVDSAMANFVEQLNLPNKKVLVHKPGQPTPTFKNKWEMR